MKNLILFITTALFATACGGAANTATNTANANANANTAPATQTLAVSPDRPQKIKDFMMSAIGPAQIRPPTSISLNARLPPFLAPKYFASIRTVGILANSDGWNCSPAMRTHEYEI